MAVDNVPTAQLLTTLTEALAAATTAFPADADSILPPAEGISLLDVKNDLLLSYLQNLVFLILLRLRSGSKSSQSDGKLDENVIRKLTELRVYIERGVRPLEGRLRYQIDKVIRAANETERAAAQNSKPSTKKSSKKQTNGAFDNNSSAASNSASDSDGSGSEEDDNEDNEDREETLHRPNALALAQKIQESTSKSQSKSSSSRTAASTGAYKPPRITPTAMPTAETSLARDQARSRNRKSNLLNEYIDEELSSTPRAQPSIGSNNTILDRGRSGLSTRDREKERERLEYEEKNFVRLPGESKAERRKARLRGENNRRDMFGGEDWTGLGGMGDRVSRSVLHTKGGKASVLERRQKRGRDTQDGQRGDGLGIGEAFTKRQKIMDDRAERKRRKRE